MSRIILSATSHSGSSAKTVITQFLTGLPIRRLCLLILIAALSACSNWRTINNLPSPAAGARPLLVGEVYRDYWLNVSGLTIADLRAAPGFPDSPDGTDVWTRLQAPVNVGDNFGSLVTGVIYPPDDGEYTFYLSSDDQSEFWLSTDSDPANLKQIANVPGWVAPFDYTGSPSQISDPVALKAGQPYAFKLLHKEGQGGDNVAVEWEGPSIARQVINSDYIASGVEQASGSTSSQDFAAGYKAGYRIGYFDGGENLAFNDLYPPLDQDKDGMYDNWEVLNGLNPNNAADADSDTDGDLLTAYDEFKARTSPTNADTDGDGLPDGVEYAYNLDPTDPSDAKLDLDNDGVSNLAEYQAGTDFSDPKSVPTNAPESGPGFGTQFYSGMNFENFLLARKDPSINFNWGSGSPDPAIPANQFSARWTGEFVPPHTSGSKDYKFTVKADDGVRLWVNGSRVINQWKDQGPTTYSSVISLPANTPAAIRMEYYENGGGAVAQLGISDVASGQSVQTVDTVSSINFDSPVSPDTDGDGIPDSWELQYGLNMLVNDASQVHNSSGTTSLEAYQNDLNPWTLEPVTGTPSQPVVDSGGSTGSSSTSVTLTWSIPLTRVDGTSLAPGEIDHFVLNYGQSQDSLTQTVTIAGSETTYSFDSLKSGTWYFDIVAVDTNGLESPRSEIVSAVVQ